MNIELLHEHTDQAVPHSAVFQFSAVRIDRILEDLSVKVCARNSFSLFLKSFVQCCFLVGAPLRADVVAIFQ